MSVYRRKDGASWYAIIEQGRDPITGRRRRRTQAGFATKREAQRWLRKTLTAVEDGAYVEPADLTLGAFLTEQWLPAREEHLAPTTFDSYRRTLARHVVPHLGGMPLQRLTATDLNALYRKLATESKLGPRTRRYVHTILHRALDDAVKWGKVMRNVADAAEAPPPKAARASAKRARAVWTPEQRDAFLLGTREHRLWPAFVVCADTGLRRSELLGLRWRDLSAGWEEAPRPTLRVRQVLVVVRGAFLVKEPKTEESARTVPLAPRTVEALRAQRKRQVQERLALGPDYADDDLVFAKEDGTPLHPSTFSKLFQEARAESGLPHVRLHDLRHGFATTALKEGLAVKVVSGLLGHTGVSTTLDIYTSSDEDLDREAVLRIVGAAGEAAD